MIIGRKKGGRKLLATAEVFTVQRRRRRLTVVSDVCLISALKAQVDDDLFSPPKFYKFIIISEQFETELRGAG